MERSLESTLRRIGRWIVLIGGACGIGWGLLATGIFLTVMVWLDLVWELPPHVRIASLAGSVIVGLLLLGLSFARSWRQTAVPVVARHLDHVASTGGQILAGVDLSNAGEGILRTGTPSAL